MDRDTTDVLEKPYLCSICPGEKDPLGAISLHVLAYTPEEIDMVLNKFYFHLGMDKIREARAKYTYQKDRICVPIRQMRPQDPYGCDEFFEVNVAPSVNMRVSPRDIAGLVRNVRDAIRITDGCVELSNDITYLSGKWVIPKLVAEGISGYNWMNHVQEIVPIVQRRRKLGSESLINFLITLSPEMKEAIINGCGDEGLAKAIREPRAYS